MLPSKYRLKGPKDFQKVFDKGQRIWHTNFLLISYIDEAIINGPKFGFIASKKVGGAVERNYAKRLMRELVYKNIDNFSTNSYHILIANHKTQDLDIHSSIKFS